MATLGSAENEQALVELLDTQQTQDIGVAEWLHMFNTQTSDTWKDEPSETERP
jgi:hypothetical protein